MKIIITKEGNFTRKDISKMIEQGIVIIEAKNPEDIRIISDADFIHGDALTMSALKALADTDNMSANSRFMKELNGRLIIKENKNL